MIYGLSQDLLRRLCCVLFAYVLCLPGAIADSSLQKGLPVESITVVAPDNFPPLLFRDTSGELQGSVKETWALWEARTKIKVNLRAADWTTVYQEMLSGKADVLDMVRVTEERQKFLDFSEPYTQLNMMLYFHNSITAIVDAKTSRGFLIGVIEAGGCGDKLRAAGSDNLKQYLTFDELVSAAARDEVRVFCAYEPQANYFLNRLGKAKEFRHSPPLYSADGHWAVRKGNQSMRQLVADGFAKISSAEREQITSKWMGAYIVGPEAPLYVRYAGYALLVLLCVGLVLLAWNQTLRRRVSAKTAALTQTLASLERSQEATVAVNDHLEELVAIRSAELSARTGELQTIVDTASSGIALITDRIIIRGNRRMHEMFGWPMGEMLGQSTAIWYPEESTYLAAGGTPYTQILRGEVHCREQELKRKDGSRFWGRLTGTAIDPADPANGTVWVIDDITNEREILIEMERAREQAEAANVAKSDFLANMSHEIRTPLNAIIGLTHLLEKKGLDKDTTEKLEQVHASGKHLLHLINDILDFSKIEAGMLAIVHEPLSVGTITENVVSILTENASAKGIELRTESDELPRVLSGDTMRITQTLFNLAGNAIKFTPSGSVTIRVLKENETESQIKLRFEVVDTGIGIAADKLPNLFAPFVQADSTMSKRFGGTGLGLAITRKLAEMMGGEAGAISAQGQGSTFWFTAVLDKIEESLLLQGTEQIKDACLEIASNFSGCRILLVEDDEINRIVAQENLADARLEIEIACDGIQALNKMREAVPGQYAMILMDMQMPNMNGLEATQEIRKLAVAKDLPIIAMTANAFNEDRERCFAAGMNDFIAKPVDPEQMFETILRWLRRGAAINP